MKKVYMLFFSLLVLSACSTNETATNDATETSSTIETSAQSSKSSISELASETSTEETTSEAITEESSSKEDKEEFPYAVDLDDFIGGKDPAGKTIHHQTFETNQDDLPPNITVDIKALNNYGKEISIDLTGGEHSLYPVSITSIPTKTVTLLGDNGEKRDVKVNTEVKIEKYKEYDDSLQIEGDTYYLFYNDEGTISLATRNFEENPGDEDLDSKNMVEYVQEYPNSAEVNEDEDTKESSEDKSEEDEAKAKEYYDAINDAWQEASDYINSIDDPDVQVQSSEAAGSQEAERLKKENPEDTEIIEESFQKVRKDKW